MSIAQDRDNRFETFTDWSGYEKYLEAVGPHVRVTYLRGRLELLTTSFEHERWKSIIRGLIEELLIETTESYEQGGATTFKRKDLDSGLEPDECYWIRNWEGMVGKKRWESPRDPAPDLILEIDVTSSSLSRIDIYRTMKVPEVWRYRRSGRFDVLLLGDDGEYHESASSPTFPLVPLDDIRRFITLGKDKSAGQVRAAFRRWLRHFMTSLQTGQDC